MIEKCVINAIVALIELICINEICRKTKKERYLQKLAFVIFGAIYIGFAIISTAFVSNKSLILCINLIAMFLFTLGYNIKFYKRILIVIIYCVFAMAYEILTMLLMSSFLNVSVDNLQSNIEHYLLAAIISKFALFLTIKVVLLFAKPSDFVVDIKYGLLNLILPITTLGMLIILSNIVFASNNIKDKISILSVSILLIFANFATFIIYEYSLKNKIDKERQRAELAILNERQSEYVDLINQQLRSNREIHDFKHKMFKIKKEIGENEGEAIKIVNELCEVFEQKKLIEYTGLKDVDALLNVKMKKASQKNMDLKYHILFTDNILINSMDLCVLVGNILDNAIDHSAIIRENNIIELNMHTINNFLAISSNNMTDIVNVNIGKSVKKDEYKFHGYGLVRIEEISKKYLGNVDYGILNNKYEINIMLNNCNLHPENC